MICSKHGVRMPVVRGGHDRCHAPLHRCPKCTEEFRLAVDKAMYPNGSRPLRSKKQFVLPPVVMPERWPL